MSRVKPKWRLLAIVLAVVGFLVAFGVALAATVQVSREVGSTLSVVAVDVVLPEANLVLSHDPEGTIPVTALSFELVKLQAPLEPRRPNQNIFIRNDATTTLTLIEPCREVVDAATTLRLGHMNVSIHTLATEEFRGSACGGVAAIAPGETVGANVHINDVDPGLAAGDHSFTALFGAIGETP